jgi:hypothetical protein
MADNSSVLHLSLGSNRSHRQTSTHQGSQPQDLPMVGLYFNVTSTETVFEPLQGVRKARFSEISQDVQSLRSACYLGRMKGLGAPDIFVINVASIHLSRY